MLFNRKKNDNRQQWKPHWFFRLLYKIWQLAFTAAKIALGAAATALMIVVVCMFVFVGILGDYLQEDILPNATMENILTDYEHEQNSYMYYVDNNGEIQLYQNIYPETSSKWAEYEDIPENLINAAISIEDHRFYEHQGVDWITTIKATARMFFGDSSVGGSSITQQLIKNVLLSEDDSADEITVQRKVLEIFRAIQLEKSYDKETIMEMYLNVIYLGQNCRGVRSAAASYFGKELEKLTLAECASLISITNNPSLFDPYNSEVFTYAGEERDGMQRNRYRQEIVLEQMLVQGWITEDEYEEALAQELVLKSGIDDEDRLTACSNPECDFKDIRSTFVEKDGAYYCPECGNHVNMQEDASREYYSWYAETVLEDVAKALAEKDGVDWNSTTSELYTQKIQRGGYHIYTCLDMDVQEHLDSIYTDLDKIPAVYSGQQLQSAMVIIDNKTGDIAALVGGVGEKEGFDNWNRATDAQLQSGSSIKPLAVYAPAFEAGVISPATVIRDMPVSYSRGAYPLNDNRKYNYGRTILRGVVSSVNAVAANTLERAGVNYCFEFARDKFGLSTLIESYTDSTGEVHSDIAIGPLAIGAQTWGVRVRDMANGFATFANNGVYRNARTFTKVYDSNGKLVLDNVQKEERILSEKTVNYMNYCLVSATSYGTGTEAKLNGITTAGKTGTTGSNKDRWYCGFTGHYTAAVWSGFDTPAVIRPLYVNNPSASLFKKVMTPIHSGLNDVSLYSTSGMVWATMCVDSGGYATSACSADIRGGRTESAMLYPEDRSGGACTDHVLVDYCSGGGVATEYCRKFAEVDDSVKITKEGLLKRTQSELSTMLAPGGYMDPAIRSNNYIYLINSNGSDAVFKGIDGKLKQWKDAPYVICPEHTPTAWAEYEEAQATEPPTEPPVEPPVVTPTEPVVQPTEPAPTPTEPPADASASE